MQKLHLPQEITLLKVANKSFAKYYHAMPGLCFELKMSPIFYR